MSSSAVAKQPSQQVSKGGQQPVAESSEQSASANASAGLNLNVFGAVYGLFAGKFNKETQADGSSVEQKDQRAAVKGAGAANTNAVASANVEQKDKMSRAAIQDE